MASPRPPSNAGGFTLLEVMIAVAILSISLTSLLSSQMTALKATRYAQGVSAAAFLAEQQLIEMEWQLRRDGWSDFDQELEGDFSEQGWDDITYKCIADKIELPEYSQIQAMVDAGGSDDGSQDGVQDAGEQAFGMLGMVWSIVKSAVEESIRKASCTVYWQDGAITYDVQVATFWTDMDRLNALPQLGGDAGEEGEGEEGGGTPGPGTTPGGGGAGPGGPGSRPGGGISGPMAPPSQRGRN